MYEWRVLEEQSFAAPRSNSHTADFPDSCRRSGCERRKRITRFVPAATGLLRRSDFHRIGRSTLLRSGESKPPIRCVSDELAKCGTLQTYAVAVNASAESPILRSRLQHRVFGGAVIFTEPVVRSCSDRENPNRPFAAAGFNNRDAGRSGHPNTRYQRPLCALCAGSENHHREEASLVLLRWDVLASLAEADAMTNVGQMGLVKPLVVVAKDVFWPTFEVRPQVERPVISRAPRGNRMLIENGFPVRS